jgi:hypothetical protein
MTQVNTSVSLISIFTYKLVLTIENIFRALTSRQNDDNKALREWARIEFKHDSNFAYNYVKEFGKVPTIGASL